VAASNRQHSQASTSPQYGQAHTHESIGLPQFSHNTTSSLVLAISRIYQPKLIILLHAYLDASKNILTDDCQRLTSFYPLLSYT